MLLICLLFYFLRFINTAHPMGLNMIVKNETPVLGRLFNSVKDIISYYVIVSVVGASYDRALLVITLP